jgi:hypothetical protein
MHSRPIWSTMGFRSDDIGWCHELILGAFCIGDDSEIMLSWLNLKCYVDGKGCGRKLSRPYWSSLWNRIDDWGWCHDIILGDMWIGTDEIGCCLDQINTTRCIIKTETSSFHYQFEVIYGLERMILDDILT